jgi:hypothetical protein
VVEPRPEALIESLRAFGYTLPAAIADLIDNSITAYANNIWLNFFWNGADSYISLADDGCGMTQKQLIEAMRPGSQNPLEERDPADLGRFGLGLKTASFSQCRRVTVRSRPDGGKQSTRSWDLDYVNQTGEWRLLKDVDASTTSRLARFNDTPHGTIVLWEVLDRIVEDDDPDDSEAEQRFLALIDDVEIHLAIVFHRFMQGSRPLRIYINGTDKHRLVKPWNPFLEDHSATQQLQSERIPFQGTTVRVLPFVLPHHDKLERHVFDFASGPRGWNAHQGFYVYRNKRLLVAGDWLGLGYAKEEHYKLARIQVDIPNSTDGEWRIDVKKSHAYPPVAIRQDLTRIAELTRKRAVEVYRHRGRTLARNASQPHVFAWKPVKRGNKKFYAINRDHPLISRALDVPKEHRPAITAMLKLLEETVPIEQIWLDKADAPDDHGKPFEMVRDKEVVEVLTQVYIALRKEGCSPTEARRRILSMDAFASYPELVATLADRIS